VPGMPYGPKTRSVVLGNLILRYDRPGFRGLGMFERTALDVTRSASSTDFLQRFTSADPVAVHRSRTGVQSRADGIAPKMLLGGAGLVTMMEAAEFRDRNHAPRVRRLDRARFRRVLLQSQVRPALMIVVHETLQVTVQAPFAEHDHVVQALAADGADDPFHISSVPRGNFQQLRGLREPRSRPGIPVIRSLSMSLS